MEQYKIELSHVDCITDRQGYWLKAITVVSDITFCACNCDIDVIVDSRSVINFLVYDFQGITILIIILHARSVQLIADNIHYDYD